MSSGYESLGEDPPPRFNWKTDIFKILLVLIVFTIAGVIMFLIVYFMQPLSQEEVYAKYTAQFLETLSGEECKNFLYNLTRIPSTAGTVESKRQADYIMSQFKQWGLEDTKLVRYDVLLSHPTNENVVQLIEKSTGKVLFDADLYEAVVEEDETSKINKTLIPPFIAYSPSGDVRDELVYCNYATLEDFQRLENEFKISVKDKIVIARYGQIYRGLKVQLAEERGAKAILLYSDPANDGFSKGEVYPDGPWRPSTAVQRGAATYDDYCGDPTTPGQPSIPGTPYRINRNEATNIPQKVLAYPIGYKNALSLLQSLRGPLAPKGWIGGLNITYRIGGGNEDTIVRVKVQNREEIVPIYNVITTIKGAVEPDRIVILGNHRDAWVYGAVDPHTGTAAFMDIGRALGTLVKSGWKPRRTVILASWDAEEYGLIGSTEWVEHHRTILEHQAVAYINVDNISGPKFYASASPSLLELFKQVTKQVPYAPDPSITVYDQWKKSFGDKEPTTDWLGSGSDHTPFIHHLGIPSADLFFYDTAYGVYHSLYDSYAFVQKFVDPNATVCKMAASVLGLFMLDFAHEDVLPFVYDYQNTVMKKAYQDMLAHKDIVEFKNSLNEQQKKQFESALTQIEEALQRFESILEHVYKETQDLEKSNTYRATKLRRLNDKLMFAERAFIASEGLQGRNWFRHVLCAPVGYGYEVFPGLMEGARSKNFQQTMKAISQIVIAIQTATSILTTDINLQLE